MWLSESYTTLDLATQCQSPTRNEERPMTEGQSAQGLARRQSDHPDVRSSGEPRVSNSSAPSSAPLVESPDDRVRVVLAEDDVLLREGLASLLDRSGFDVVGQAGDGVELLAMVRDQKPELVV